MIPLFGEFDIGLWCLLRFLFERVKHENAVSKFYRIDHPITLLRPYSNFSRAGADTGHRLPVSRCLAELNPIQFKAGNFSGFERKVFETIQRVAAPYQTFSRLNHLSELYWYQYNVKPSPDRVAGHRPCAPNIILGRDDLRPDSGLIPTDKAITKNAAITS